MLRYRAVAPSAQIADNDAELAARYSIYLIVAGGGDRDHFELWQLLELSSSESQPIGDDDRGASQPVHHLVLAGGAILDPFVRELRSFELEGKHAAIQKNDSMPRLRYLHDTLA